MKKSTSPYIVVKESRIHSKGIFAKIDIPKGTKIIEYVGDKVTKAESLRRVNIPLERHKKDSNHGAVYMFELNQRYDIDGDVTYNTAKYINHSCHPNCEPVIISGHIWIIALKNIKKEDEITYNYGYGYDEYEDHKCRCSSPNCVGYILAKKHWPKLKKTKTT